MNCLLILALVCHPAQHKAQLALTGVQAAMMTWDGFETRRDHRVGKSGSESRRNDGADVQIGIPVRGAG